MGDMKPHFRAIGAYLAVSALLGGAGLITAANFSCTTVPPTFTPPPPIVLAAETARVAFQSQCAQNIIECTTSWPVAIVEVVAGEGQTVTVSSNGILVEGVDGDGQEWVNLVGSGSTMGDGATVIEYAWTFGATDADPQTLAAGDVFSVAADFSQRMAVGKHYIRLGVINDIVREQVVSDEFGVIAENVPSFDFVELEIEVRGFPD